MGQRLNAYSLLKPLGVGLLKQNEALKGVLPFMAEVVFIVTRKHLI